MNKSQIRIISNYKHEVLYYKKLTPFYWPAIVEINRLITLLSLNVIYE